MKTYNPIYRSPRFGYGRLLFLLLAFSILAGLLDRETFAQNTSSPRVARMVSSYGMPEGRPAFAAAPNARTTVSYASPVPPKETTSLERQVFQLINAERLANGLTPLLWDADLCGMARAHSKNMATLQFFDHVGPDRLDTSARAHARGIYGWKMLAENIAVNQGYQDPGAFAVRQWMHSSKHRANILRAELTSSGIGIAQAADGGLLFTQVFAVR
jgi:uncharacterized protein YkwD